MKRIIGLTIALLLCVPAAVWADAGVFTGTGQNLRQISTKSVQLVSIDVKIVLGRGPFLFDGSVPGMDEARYSCKFVLRNLTDKPCDIEIGFPIDSESHLLPKDEKVPGEDRVSWCGFNARDDDNTYHVLFQKTDPKNVDDAYSALFTWTMSFKAKETRTLVVEYHIPISMGVDSPDKGAATVPKFKEHPWMPILDTCLVEIVGYTTETGSTWSGNVESATFAVTTGPFERYLNHRGFDESDTALEPPEQRKVMAAQFPVHHGWWYRDVQPAGWKSVENGIQWQYKNFKPKDPLTITYYLLQYPTEAGEVDAWVDAILRTIPDKAKHPAELAIVKQILLATYGKAPTDADALGFCKDQIWYAPSKDFAASKLSKEQQAVVAALDRRIDALSKR